MHLYIFLCQTYCQKCKNRTNCANILKHIFCFCIFPKYWLETHKTEVFVAVDHLYRMSLNISHTGLLSMT